MYNVHYTCHESYADGIMQVIWNVYIPVIHLFLIAAFQRRRKYNIPVHVCAHPELNQYIRDVLDGIRPLLEAGQVKHVAVLIKNKVGWLYTHIPPIQGGTLCFCAFQWFTLHWIYIHMHVRCTSVKLTKTKHMHSTGYMYSMVSFAV